MEKTITLRNTEITFSIWDLGGQREFISMLPLVCNDAVTIFLMFDLSRKSTLLSIKEWYRQARGLNRVRAATLPPPPFTSPFLCPLLVALSADRTRLLGRDQIRHLHNPTARRARGDRPAGPQVRQGDESAAHLHLRQPLHQRPEDLQDRPESRLRPEEHHGDHRGCRRAAAHLLSLCALLCGEGGGGGRAV
jgi:hypothetical protein